MVVLLLSLYNTTEVRCLFFIYVKSRTCSFGKIESDIMIYVTGNCQSDFKKFSIKNFPDQKDMTKDDCVIICGDLGGI